jgi:polysaccharide biosynthesis protein PslH
VSHLVWFSHFVPHPPIGGHMQRSFNLLRAASRARAVTLIAFNMLGEDAAACATHAAALREFCDEVEIWPMPVRWRGPQWWARLLLDRGGPLPHSCRCFWSRDVEARWQAVLARNAGALLHFDALDLAAFEPASRGFARVLNHHNYESELTARRAEAETNSLKRAVLAAEARRIRALEATLCARFDVNITVSERDAAQLAAHAKGSRFHVVENGVDTEFFRPQPAQPEPQTVVFAASMHWAPNVAAAEFVLRDVWPLVRQQRPQARLTIAGQRPPMSLRHEIERAPDATLIADPPDMRPVLARASVVICPVREGGGTRLKILDAMAMSKAVVSTTIGAEGLDVRDGEQLLLADTPVELAAALVRVWSDTTLRERLAAAARRRAEERYSWNVIAAELEQAYGCATDPASCRLHRRAVGL